MLSPTTRLFLSFLITAITVAVKAYPPEDAVKCRGAANTDCTLTNAYGSFTGRVPCRTEAAAFPASESELIATVAAATRRGQKMKASPRHSHSIPRLACPGGDGAGLAVSTARMAAVLAVDAAEGTVTAEAGATLRSVVGAAAAAGLAVPHGPYWWGVTLGGMLGSGAHGSSLWGRGSAVHEYVVALTLVSPGGPHEGFVRVRRLLAGRDDEELDAVKVALGVLGLISQVTLKVQPMFKRSITYVTKNDTDLGDTVSSFGREHEFADIIWYPSQRKAVYRVDDRVPVNTPGNGLYDFIPFRSTSTSIISTVRTTEENEEFLNDDEGKCIGAKIVTSTLSLGAYGLTNDGMTFTGYPVIGYQNRMQSSGSCLDSKADDPTTACAWDPRTKGESFHQTTFSLTLASAKPFIKDVQALVKLEPRALCGTELYNGILIRYVTASSAYLGKDSDSVDFDITYFRHGSQLDDPKPRLHEDVLEEIEQMAVLRYGALPHWGKNRHVAFIGAAAKYENLTRFLRVKAEFDPLGLFSSEWSDQVLGLKAGIEVLKEGCALEGLCICKEDLHCAPQKGYFCRPGRVYKKARVCKLDARVPF